jgi:hypothetical protein
MNLGGTERDALGAEEQQAGKVESDRAHEGAGAMAKHYISRGPGSLDDRLWVRAWQLLPLFEAADPRLGLPCNPKCSECHLWHLRSIVPQLVHTEALAGLSSDAQARVYWTTLCLSHDRVFHRWWLEHTTVPNDDAIRYRTAVTWAEREAIVARMGLEGGERLRRQKGTNLTWQDFRAAWREVVEGQPGLPAANVAIRKASVIWGSITRWTRGFGWRRWRRR